jgi:hypothetical protein
MQIGKILAATCKRADPAETMTPVRYSFKSKPFLGGSISGDRFLHQHHATGA